MHVNCALWETRGVELLRLGIGFLHAENTASTHENTTETGSKDNSIPECELFYINLSVSPAGNPAERDVDHSGFASNLSASFDTGEKKTVTFSCAEGCVRLLPFGSFVRGMDLT